MARTCTICSHPDRQNIDLALVSGQSQQDVSACFRVGHDAVRRHGSNHIGLDLRRAAQRRSDLRADGLLAAMLEVANEAREALHRAKETGNDRLALAALREMRETAKVLAAMSASPDEEEILALVKALGRVLPRHPEVAGDLVTELNAQGFQNMADALGIIGA